MLCCEEALRLAPWQKTVNPMPAVARVAKRAVHNNDNISKTFLCVLAAYVLGASRPAVCPVGVALLDSAGAQARR